MFGCWIAEGVKGGEFEDEEAGRVCLEKWGVMLRGVSVEGMGGVVGEVLKGVVLNVGRGGGGEVIEILHTLLVYLSESDGEGGGGKMVLSWREKGGGGMVDGGGKASMKKRVDVAMLLLDVATLANNGDKPVRLKKGGLNSGSGKSAGAIKATAKTFFDKVVRLVLVEEEEDYDLLKRVFDLCSSICYHLVVGSGASEASEEATLGNLPPVPPVDNNSNNKNNNKNKNNKKKKTEIKLTRVTIEMSDSDSASEDDGDDVVIEEIAKRSGQEMAREMKKVTIEEDESDEEILVISNEGSGNSSSRPDSGGGGEGPATTYQEFLQLLLPVCTKEVFSCGIDYIKNPAIETCAEHLDAALRLSACVEPRKFLSVLKTAGINNNFVNQLEDHGEMMCKFV